MGLGVAIGGDVCSPLAGVGVTVAIWTSVNVGRAVGAGGNETVGINVALDTGVDVGVGAAVEAGDWCAAD